MPYILQELLPNNHSVILVSDFKSPKELAEYLEYLNKNDEEYNKYLLWKKTGITNKVFRDMMEHRSWSIVDTWKYGQTNFVEDFECFVCDRVHQNLKRNQGGEKELKYIAQHSHLQCPEPATFSGTEAFSWKYEYQAKSDEAKALRYFAEKNIKITNGDFHAKLSEISHLKRAGWF